MRIRLVHQTRHLRTDEENAQLRKIGEQITNLRFRLLSDTKLEILAEGDRKKGNMKTTKSVVYEPLSP
jgi:beta-lactamase class A